MLKRVKTKLIIIFLLIVAGFSYQYVISIHDSDIQKAAQQLVEQKLTSVHKIRFDDVRIIKRNQYKEGEAVRVCGNYQIDETGNMLPFVASIDIRDGKLSGHNQLLLSDTAGIQASIMDMCKGEST